MSDKIDEQFITLRDAAEGTSYSVEYLNIMIRKGKLKGKKIGRNWYTTREEIYRYMREQQEAAFRQLQRSMLPPPFLPIKKSFPDSKQDGAKKSALLKRKKTQSAHDGNPKILREEPTSDFVMSAIGANKTNPADNFSNPQKLFSPPATERPSSSVPVIVPGQRSIAQSAPDAREKDRLVSDLPIVKISGSSNQNLVSNLPKIPSHPQNILHISRSPAPSLVINKIPEKCSFHFSFSIANIFSFIWRRVRGQIFHSGLYSSPIVLSTDSRLFFQFKFLKKISRWSFLFAFLFFLTAGAAIYGIRFFSDIPDINHLAQISESFQDDDSFGGDDPILGESSLIQNNGAFGALVPVDGTEKFFDGDIVAFTDGQYRLSRTSSDVRVAGGASAE